MRHAVSDVVPFVSYQHGVRANTSAEAKRRRMFVKEYMMSDDRELGQLAAPLDQQKRATPLEPERDLRAAGDAPLPDSPAVADSAPDGIQAYLTEIGRVPLLSFAEEVELAERMASGAAASQRLQLSQQLAPQL